MLVGVGLQMTSPGVPMVFAGDELGLEGQWGEDARRTMPWGATERWDDGLLDWYRRLSRCGARAKRSRAEGSATHTSATMRSRTCARCRVSGCCASQRAPPTSRFALALDARSLETLVGGDSLSAGDGVFELPGDGPAFHVWSVHGGG